MNRREFLANVLKTGVLALPGLPTWASADALAGVATLRRTLVNVTLPGGPDMRHLLPPRIATGEPADSYASAYWLARARSHGITTPGLEGSLARWNEAYDQLLDPYTKQPLNVGMLKSCGWLKAMWDAGHVAFINNVVGADSRDHSHALLVLDQGDRSSSANDFSKPGWGGRLAALLGGDARVAALTTSPRRFCLSPAAGNPSHGASDLTLSVRDSRNLGLPDNVLKPDAKPWEITSPPNVMARALKAYYAARNWSADSPYARFALHEESLRSAGEKLKARLGTAETGANALLPVPDAIRALYTAQAGQPAPPGPRQYWGRQMRNLHDLVAVSDILNTPVVSLEYGGWDTHQNEKNTIESNLRDLFGTNMGFDALYQNLAPAARSNLVFVIAGEFGRQLAANGDGGTDHGRGSTFIVIGDSVRGGIYGNMFPESEKALFSRGRNDDIKGLTGIEHLFGAVADWVARGDTGNLVANRNTSLLEAGVDLKKLFIA
ncbi:DUF1501 domain-containing protein [Chitinimonas lacunae]|uniref:DUF1501 domain-containing protein n=1 Tax=Chitinimonas lacunae TaxID=1963018 RepID=A0ABV8MWX4_9NEIS